MASRKMPCVMQGYPWLPGENPLGDGYNFTVEVPEGTEASLLLYYKNAKTPSMEIPFQENNRTGEVCSVFLKDFSPEAYEYNYRIDGKVVQDVYAFRILGRDHFGKKNEPKEEHKVRCALLTQKAYDWEEDQAPGIPYEDLILYKVHVRGYTKQCKNMVKKKGTFSGLEEMIPYWKELGVNAIELMPAYEFEELATPVENSGMITEKRAEDKVNFWGYGPGYYFAPKASYCASKEPEREVRDFVKALHKAGMECIMEMYFPETTNPAVALRAVQFWRLYYHVDGFHLSGAGAPVDMIARDPLLYGTKIFALGFSGELLRKGGGQKKRALAEYNPGFLQDMRRFLKSDEEMVSAAAYRIRRNPESHAVINYMANQDGFTLNDAVTYTYK
ncbi:glycogen debranching enzyme GlgX, partial [gut metagenome]